MRIDRDLMRGAGPVAVLKLLERRPMYGYELVEALATKTGGVLDMGQSTLYPMLYNLEAKGLIEATWQTGDSGRTPSTTPSPPTAAANSRKTASSGPASSKR